MKMKFYIGECDLEIVDSFNYLGLCFYYNGRYTQAEKQLSSQARKALFALYNQKKYYSMLSLVTIVTWRTL